MGKGEIPHLWFGSWLTTAELTRRLSDLPDALAPRLAAPPPATDAVVAAADRLSQALAARAHHEPVRAKLRACLVDAGVADANDADAALTELAGLLSRRALEAKLVRELGTRSPFLIARIGYAEQLFEGWAPLGMLVHISPQNSFLTGPMSVVEGLLAGNVNVLKTGGSESRFPQLLLAELGALDPTGAVAGAVVVARIASQETELLRQLFAAADGIAAWGGEESARQIRAMAPPSVRLVEWGHRISWAYVTPRYFADPATLEAAAEACCHLEQQACSSPQCIYLDTADLGELERFAERLAATLARVSPGIPRARPDDAEAAEISMVTACQKLEASFGRSRVLEATTGDWRIYVDPRSELAPSPLFRSVWVKPLPRAQIIAKLRPMRQYLQTVGLACDPEDVGDLCPRFFAAGATRIRRLSDMLGGYPGEPHDGLYALPRYCRRVSVQLDDRARGISNFGELTALPALTWERPPPVTPKEAFTSAAGEAHLYFKSGGSSGEPKLSTFSHEQYDAQMWLGAEGLYAAGLDPLTDRTMNLFYSGGLYGGFLSFFSALERLQVVQLPMAANPDLAMVADTIVKTRVNTLLGMPSYLLSLFEQAGPVLAAYRGVEKVFYAGEHFTDAQRRYLTERFGVRLIRSGAYGSVDIGPMGYQCQFCEEGVHHLQQRLHALEILQLDADLPVSGTDVGRLVFTPREATSNKPSRYAIGDVGRWTDSGGGRCPCGRGAPRFQLLGRTGDIFRIATMFFNYQKFQKLAADAGHAGELQVRLETEGLRERLVVSLAAGGPLAADAFRGLCLEHYDDLRDCVSGDRLMAFVAETVPAATLERSPASGKLRRVVDARSRR